MLWASRLFYLADLAAGVLQGTRCPSCKSSNSRPLHSPARRLNYFRECDGCGLFYRPTGLLRGRIPELYYSHFYDAGLATSEDALEGSELCDRLVGEEGKNRNDLVRLLNGPPESGEIAVFGCSWGYEVRLLRSAGYAAFGIELSQRRRGWGRSRLGLPIYESGAAAAADGRAPKTILSSHVLEHIPEVESMLTELHNALRPQRHLHITPYVDDFRTNGSCGRNIGREHPLGITTGFWKHWCGKHRFGLETWRGGDGLPGTGSWELIAKLDTRSRG